MPPPPLIELRAVDQLFRQGGGARDVSFTVWPGEVHCLLGDNGAGKSTLIKILSGVHRPTRGEILVDGKPVRFGSPARRARRGIATVYQDLAMLPLMSIARNFFLGREPTKGWVPFRTLDMPEARRDRAPGVAEIGISVRDLEQPVGTLSGGERQCVAIARAVYLRRPPADPR